MTSVIRFAPSVADVRLLTAGTLAAAILLSGCTKPQSEPLAKVPLNPQQAEALRRMNEAGTTVFTGHTWRYEFGAGCILRVSRAFEGRKETPQDHSMIGRHVEVVAYAENGFGVKAYANGKGGSVDLFDSASSAEAKTFAHFAGRLVEPCSAR